jgi:hypothetical protein
MQYRFLKKAFGTHKVSLDIKFEFDKNIIDICFVNDGILFIAEDYPALGFLGLDGSLNKEWMGKADKSDFKNGDIQICRFKKPEAIFSDSKFIYILDDGGNYLRSLNYSNKYVETITGKNYISQFKKHYRKNSRLHGVSLGRGRFYFSSSEANKCFAIQNGKLAATIGDGRPRFCVSTSPRHASFNCPMGIGLSGGQIYISDSKNTCVRTMDLKSGAITVAMGCPPESKGERTLTSPSKIAIKKNQVFVLDENKIKVSNIEMHNSDTIIAFDIDQKLNAYILEKSCGKE